MMALALPEVTEDDRHDRRVVRRRQGLPGSDFSKADIKRYGDVTPPSGDILAVASPT